MTCSMSESVHATPRDSERKQSLVNKCLNERRRRDQENHYFEELAEIITASLTDMSSTFSVKPEKCAILQETVKQIKQIKQGNSGGGDSAVQQSQVSSSKPAILADDILGPLLLEALDGFLFVVNSQGKVEFVSENVTLFIKYTQDDLIGKSVYNIIHVGDHAQFSNNLLPMSVSSGIGGINWPSDNLGGKGRVFSCRLLIKPSCNDNDDLETKQTYVHQYESLQISSILHPSDTFTENSESNDTSSSLVCIARRLPLAEKTNTMLGVEQFTTKQDLNGKIIGCDISGIAPGRFSCPDFVGQNIQEFCHTNDLQQLSKHLQEAVKNGSNTSGVYRFKMQECRYAFVQTKSKLFQNPINGSSEFIMSTHSIIRECDSDNELKGSASTSLMKSIIGPSLQQTLQKAQTPISNVNTSLASMALVGNNMMPSLNSGSLFGVSDNNSEDFFHQLGWDGNLADSSVSSTGNSVMNSTYQSVANNSTSSFSNSWNNSQIKLSQVQQQLQRSLSTSSQRNQVANSNSMGPAGNKRPSVLLGQLGQRSTSLDLGQMHGQGQISQPQKSPSYTQSRNGGFQIPPQRGLMGYSRRSPAASPVPSIGQGNFNTPFSPRTPSPMLSPSPGMPQSGWGHQSMTSNAGQSGHQLYDDQASYTHERLLQHLTGLESITGDKKVKRSGKLCQLLTQNSPPSSSRKSEPGTPKGGRSRHNSRQGYLEMSPADSIQSPQPGPGQSPPEKPQSTSNDDGEHVIHTENKDSNRLLKSLLSQEDDAEDEPVKDDNSAVKNEQSAEAQAVPQKSVGSVEMEKNEAEAKKPNNILLKQLLSTDEGPVLKDTSDVKQGIMHKLLDEDKKDNCRSVPAESTSIDSELARQRHQSGPQEPQSTTTHSLPMPPLSSPLTSPVTPNFNQSQSSHIDTSLLKGLFSSSPGLSHNQVTSTNSSAFPSVSGSIDTSSNMREDGFSASREKKIDKLLHLLWEDNSNDGSRESMRERIQNLKRKADMLEGGDTEQSNAFSGGLTSSQASRLTKENALLTQLLSKKANNDIVVNTLSTIQPSGIPQQRIPQNLATKLLKVNPSSFITTNSGNEAKRARIDSGNNNQLSTLERALSTPKQDLNAISSTQSFDAMMEIGQNSNSGISNISDSSVSSQFNNQLSDLHQILQSTISDTGSNSTNVTEVNLDDNTDPLLAQILQQAQDLQQDITLGSFHSSGQNVPHSLSLDSGPVNMNAQSVLNHSNLNNNSYQKNNTNTDILQQLEQALNESNFNLDSLLGNSNVSSMDEQVAIDAIQKQLMMDMPGLSTTVSASNAQTPTIDSGRVQARFSQNIQVPAQTAGSQIQQNMLGNQLSGRNQGAPGMFQTVGSLRQGIGGPSAGRPLQQPPGYNQATPTGQNYPGQGPRLPHPQGALPSPTQQQRPMFSNSNPNSTAMQVRQSLLQQQKLKAMRERNKNVQQQQQDRQKLLMQQQQQQQQQRSQFSPQYSGQQGPQDNLSLGGNNVIPQFPENLAELMNSGTAPNVTLQRNQIPGPMSPRYQTLPGQPPQSPNIGSMMPPNPQLSPNFSQTQQQQQQQQWNIRQGQTSLAISPQGTAQYNNRHRSLSGGTLQTSPPQRFPFNDGQYSGNQQLGNLYTQQQQQQLYQNRGGQLQRQLSRGGSPRASQSPFGPSSDPLLMSPHNVSPNSMRAPQQMSPSYSQGGMGSAFGQGSLASQPGSLPSPQYTQNQGQGQMGMNAHTMDIDLTSLFDSSKKPLDVPLSVNTPGPSKTIKEELRNFCNARSQNSLQGQSSLQNSLQGQSSLQNSLQGQSSLQSSLQGQSSLQSSLQGQSSLQNSLQGQSSLQNQNFLQNQTALQGHSSLQSHMMAAQQSQQFMSAAQRQQHQQQQQQQQQQQTQQSMEHDTISELPLDILEQINEMTQDHGINQPEFKEEVIVPKKREEAKSRYVKFQQLAKTEDPDSKATTLFRKQLTSQGLGRAASASADTNVPVYTEPQPSVNVVQNEPRTPIEEIKPANQKDSLLQQLLSD